MYKLTVIVVVLFLVLGLALTTDRADAAVVITKVYELFKGKASIVETPFVDIGGLSNIKRDSISKLYGLGITKGTSENTYSPNNHLEFYQVLLFSGRTIQAIKY